MSAHAARAQAPAGAAALVGVLVELRSALAAGAPASLALREICRRAPTALPGLDEVVRLLGVGASLEAVCARIDGEQGPAGLLVRALAVAERTGAGAADAVTQAEAAIADQRELARSLRVRTAQARGSLRVLAVTPPAAVAFFLSLQPDALRFYNTGLGRGTALVAVLLLLVARGWARRIVARVPAAAAAVDPLGECEGGGTAEVAELLAVALRGGMSAVGAVSLVARLGPPSGRGHLARAERALLAGMAVEEAFAGGPLTDLGPLLAAPSRWGAEAEAALRAYAVGLRAERRAALAEAAERAELRLVFPTTLLTLPSFLLAVVPPLLWTGLQP